ncbi:MAG: hypothetical protein M3239_05675 [Thermoproteota archaeon]|nr:hypothetical protein [Thermoproteota archaeon]
MTDHFAFLGVKFNAVITAMTLGVLLFLPSSLGLGGTIVEEAFGQVDVPTLDGGQEDGGEEVEATLPSTTSTFLLRGIIASILPAQGGDAPIENNSSYILAGRWRIFVDEGLVNRFIAEMNLAAINGTAFHNITIEDTAPHRFELMESGNGTSTTTSTGSIPPVSSNLMTRISVDSVPIIDNVPMTISIRGQVLAIEGIDIDETRITDTGQRDILSIVDGQSIFGIVPR